MRITIENDSQLALTHKFLASFKESIGELEAQRENPPENIHPTLIQVQLEAAYSMVCCFEKEISRYESEQLLDD